MCANAQNNWLNTITVRASYILHFEAISLVKTKKKPGGGGLSPPGKKQNRKQFVF